MAGVSLMEHFRTLPDPRIERTKRHKLLDILAITICAVVSGANGFPQIVAYAHKKEAWLRTFLELPHGIPCEHTFRRVLAALDPEAFQHSFVSWVQAVSEAIHGVVAIDGKTVRHSYDTGKGAKALHVVSAWALENRLVLGQVKTDEKSNEITAIPALVQLLELKGCLVTIDAMGCQTEIAQAIVDQGADYLLAVKDNQPTLAKDIQEEFQAAHADGFRHLEHTYEKTVDKAHGRLEVRECWYTQDVAGIDPQGRWPKLHGMAMCRSTRTVNGETSVETRYYITSLLGAVAAVVLAAVRGHWGIENSLHWVLDMTFQEDRSRVRTDHGPENLAVVRHFALNLVRQDKETKGSVETKRLMAGWDDAYLMTLLTKSHN